MFSLQHETKYHLSDILKNLWYLDVGYFKKGCKCTHEVLDNISFNVYT